MRALNDMPKPVLVLEGIGMALLIVAYLSVQGYITLPGWLATPAAAVTLVFCGVGLMIPAAAVLIWRIAQGGSRLLDINGKRTSSRTPEEKRQQEPEDVEK